MAFYAGSASPDRNWSVVGLQSPGAGGTVTPDLSQGGIWPIQMPAGNITIANPINANPGDLLRLHIKQDGIGTRLVTWGNLFRKAITLSITANAEDSIIFSFDGTLWKQLGSAQAIL